MKILRISCVIVGFLCVVLSLSAQTFTTLHNFDAADGANPYAGPVQGTNGSFFGTTSAGGATGAGTAFEITSSGALAMLSFDGTDGDFPRAGLVLAGNGNFYGTTTRGGTNGASVIAGLLGYLGLREVNPAQQPVKAEPSAPF